MEFLVLSMRLFILCISFWFFFGCGSSAEKDSKLSDPIRQDVYQPPVKEVFTIFHAADDSEDVYISGVGPKGLSGFYLLPGECLLLADSDFVTLILSVGTGALDIFAQIMLEESPGLITGLFWEGGYSHVVCGSYEQIACSPQNYLIKNQGSWYNDDYVMEPQKSQYKDLSKCMSVEGKLKK